MRKIIIHFLFIYASIPLTATKAFANQELSTSQAKETDRAVHQLYHSLQTNPTPKNMAARLDVISKQWLHRPYALTALGEGASSDYDDAPRCRTDAFDCETYVDTVLALALATDPITFRQCMDQIRYTKGHVAYLTRNHFTSLDWNTSNQRQGFIKDITETLVNRSKQPVAKHARALIDKAAWYAHSSSRQIRLQGASPQRLTHQLAALKQAGSQYKAQIDTIAYIPLTTLFDKKGHADIALFKQIPNGAIVEIVRPNWDLTAIIGTHLNVSHLGFVFWDNGVLIFRQASSTLQQVIDIPLIDYLHDAQKSPTIGGINIQVVLPKTSLANGCREKSPRLNNTSP